MAAKHALKNTSDCDLSPAVVEPIGFGSSAAAHLATAWHYTVGNYLPLILRDGEIKPAIAGVPSGETPAVWFSLNQFWERTADKSYVKMGVVCFGSRLTTERYGGGLVRLGVLAERLPLRWRDHLRLGGVEPKSARGLVKAARKVGSNESDWRVHYGPVPRALWVAIQVWKGDEWVKAVES